MYFIYDKTSAVREVQRMLLIISQEQGELGEVTVDGIYQDTTAGAVLEFQKLNGLNPTSEVDFDTFSLLYLMSEDILNRNRINGDTRSVDKFPLMLGDASDAVMRLNTELLSLTRYLTDMPRADTRSFFGRATADAVKYFQRIIRVADDGIVSQELFDRIKKELAHREKFKGSA